MGMGMRTPLATTIVGILATVSNASSYPEPFREGQRKRYNKRVGDYAGLKNYGVNFIRVQTGGQSSARHAHSKQ
jgi:uncharacterized cupin superfamily protein